MKVQRKHNRSLKEMFVRLYKNKNLQALAKTENLTSSGMFIHTNSLLYPKNFLLDIIYDEPETGKQHCINAKVIHRSLKGIGVQFQHVSTISLSKEKKQFSI